MSDEPVVTGAVILALVGAVIAVLVAFGVDISDEQQKSILGLVAIVGPLVVAYFVRKKVTPASKL